MNLDTQAPRAPIRKSSAFTMIELLITIAVVAILVAIAVPSYRDFVIRANRVEGIDAVLHAMLCEERVYSRLNEYDADQCDPDGATNGAGVYFSANGLYKITIAPEDPPQNVTITAAPQGGQVNDDCGSLTLTEKGVKGSSASTVEKCWVGK